MKIRDNSECMIAFGDFIRAGREAKKLFQAQIAEEVGITQAYYSQIESGKRNPDLRTAIQICNVLGLDIHRFISDNYE